MAFLKADWRKLAIANYIVDKELLRDYLPAGTELDLWNGTCYVSLVGFMFNNVRVLGVKIPFHVNFEEVNLRFYVKRFENGEWKRGVVFIKEIVPKRVVTFIANTIYKENYVTFPMKHTWTTENDQRVVKYQWNCKGKWNKIQVRATRESIEIQPDSEVEFITEHYWGYAKINETRTNEYEVTHPKWRAYKVLDYEIDIDFGSSYGMKFEFLNSENPNSVMLAEGSLIKVEGKKKLTINS